MLKLENWQIAQLLADAVPGDCLHKDGTFKAYNPYVGGEWSKTLWFCVACDADIGNQFLPSNQNPWKHKPGCIAVEQFAKMCKAIERLKDNAIDIAAAYTHTVYELEQNYIALVIERTRQNKALSAVVLQLNKENELLREENKSLLAIKKHFDSIVDQILPLAINIGDLEAANGS